MREEQQQDEQRAVDYFLSAWDGRDEIASIAPAKPPRPDFVGTLVEGRCFGLELVEVTDRRMAHGRSLLRDKFERELTAAAAAAAVSAIVSVHFEEWEVRRLEDRAHRKGLIDRIIRLALEAGGQERDHYGVEGVDHLTIHPEAEGFGVILGRNARGRGWNEVQECISGKNAKADGYRKSLPSGAQLWLLIVAGTTFENGVEVPPRLPFDTTFDRVFFLDHWPARTSQGTNKVAELLIRRV